MSSIIKEGMQSVHDRYTRFNEKTYATLLKAVVGFGFLAVLPQLLTVSVAGVSLIEWFSVELLVVTMMLATAAQAWNIISGFTGYFSFGHATFFGIGAYITMKLLTDFSINPWIGLVAGGLFATAVGLFIGFLTFRYELRGHYFALTTLGFAVMFQGIARNMHEFRSSLGYYRPPATAYASGPGLIAFQWRDTVPYFYLILGFLVIVTAVAWAIKKSAIGVYLFAIKEDEDTARSLGIPVYRFKMFAIGTSAFFTATVGSFWSMYFTAITPSTVFAISKNIEILLPAVFGGVGTIAGPIIGAVIVLPFSELIRQMTGGLPGFDRIVYGFAILFIVLYSPRGIIHWPKQIDDLRRWLARKDGSRTATEGEDESP